MLIYICLFCHAWVGQQHLVGLFFFFFFLTLFRVMKASILPQTHRCHSWNILVCFTVIYLFFNGKELCQIVLFYVMVVFTFSTSEKKTANDKLRQTFNIKWRTQARD